MVIALLLLMVLLSRRQRERAAAAPATGEGGKRSVSDLFASNAAPAAAAIRSPIELEVTAGAGYVRLSIGIETVSDLIADLEQALDKA